MQKIQLQPNYVPTHAYVAYSRYDRDRPGGHFISELSRQEAYFGSAASRKFAKKSDHKRQRREQKAIERQALAEYYDDLAELQRERSEDFLYEWGDYYDEDDYYDEVYDLEFREMIRQEEELRKIEQYALDDLDDPYYFDWEHDYV